MVLPHGSGDLYHKYRPHKFSELCGHKEVVKSLKSAINSSQPSQAFLLVGESGTGKTSSARIMALSLNCLDKTEDQEPCLKCKACKIILSGTCVDIIEKNAADHRGIDSVRELSSTMSSMPMQVDNKVYILDEFHQMTKEAQSSLLKVLEEAPKRTYIVLCTTNLEKILPTVKNRCQIFKFKSLTVSEIQKLLEEVCAYEAVTHLDTETLRLIANASGGSPRNSLVRLQQVLQLGSEDKSQIARLLETEEAGGENLFKFFSLFSKGTTWAKIVEGYADIKEMGPPAIGMCLAGYFRNRLIGAKTYYEAKIYANLLSLFVVPFDDGKLGENQLILNLYKASELYVSK